MVCATHESYASFMRNSLVLKMSLATLAVFVAHHAYGAVLYATPWRHHAAIVAFVTGLVLLGAHVAGRRHPAARWIFAAVTLLVPVLAIGAFEGVYNHLLKDVLYLAGAPRDLLAQLFPPPTYELPNDALFEISGVLQILPAAVVARAWPRLLREAVRQEGAAA